jgi:hypothetical protein
MLKRGVVLSSLRSPEGRLDALEKIVNAVMDRRIDPDVARTLIYGIQTATNH